MKPSMDDATPSHFDAQLNVGRREWRHIPDRVHGDISVDPICWKFIDTEQFQRLRDLKQLGFGHMVYPGAVHSRFEHSLGVYWLANKAVSTLKAYQAELDIDDYDIQAVKLAGLLHDLGHAPFSHSFEHGFLRKALQGYTWSHEDMAGRLIDYIVDEHHIKIDGEIIRKVKDMILAGSSASKNCTEEKRFLYDIVSNGRNALDVDRFDYIVRDSRACGLRENFQFGRWMETMRVIDGEICYSFKEYFTIHEFFAAIAALRRKAYTHAKVMALELMYVDALLKANSYINILDATRDPATFWKIDDSILKVIEFSDAPELKESKDLILRIRDRDLYQLCGEYNVQKDQQHFFNPITPHKIICSQNTSRVDLKEEDVIVHDFAIDLTRDTKDPLHKVRFFKDRKSKEKSSMPHDIISHSRPSDQDTIVRVYCKRRELVGIVSDAFENLMRKEYRRTPQEAPPVSNNSTS